MEIMVGHEPLQRSIWSLKIWGSRNRCPQQCSLKERYTAPHNITSAPTAIRTMPGERRECRLTSQAADSMSQAAGHFMLKRVDGAGDILVDDALAPVPPRWVRVGSTNARRGIYLRTRGKVNAATGVRRGLTAPSEHTTDNQNVISRLIT